jgi:hypothetical protein
MRNFKIVILVCLIVVNVNSYSQIKVSSNGKVGINQSSPAYNLDLYGDARFWTTWGSFIFDSSGNSGRAILYPSSSAVGDLGKESNKFFQMWCHNLNYDNTYDWSDERLKEDIKPLENSLSRIKLLKAVTFNMKDEFYKTEDPIVLAAIKKDRKLDFGFIAQEAKEVYPEIVKLDSTSGMYLVNYVKLIPVLVEAIQELEARVEIMENNCCNQNNNLKSGMNGEKGINSFETKLYQNAPNPFNIQTTVRFEIPETVQSTQLHICNMTGTLLKTISINQRGSDNVTISANEFVAGLYLYSLVIDGNIIDTKQMLLTN